MTDARLKKLADVLVNYSVAVKKGEWVAIRGDASALPALRATYEAVLKAGGNPTLVIGDEAMTRTFLREASEDQLSWLDPNLQLFSEKGDVMITFLSSNNTRAMTGIDSKRMQISQKTRMPLFQNTMRRTAAGEYKWVLSQYPTEAFAQEANMSLEEYQDFVYNATYANLADPVAEWRKMAAMQQEKINWLKGKKSVTLKGANIDISLSVAGRTFINADGTKNMPDGEIFTGPVENSVNGWVRFSYPSIVGGRAVSGIELEFSEGKVVKAKAETNDDLLQAQLNTDEGSRYLGEFAIGTNFGINKFTGNILFDEKIGGTIHMAIGQSYPESGGVNQSAVHWDMICDMRNDSEIHVDGDLFYKNGQFVV